MIAQLADFVCIDWIITDSLFFALVLPQLNTAGSCCKRKCLSIDHKAIELVQKLCIDAAMKKTSDINQIKSLFTVGFPVVAILIYANYLHA